MSDILTAFELHSPAQIVAALDAGVDPRAPLRGKSPATWLTEMYSRSASFPLCLRLLLDRGAVLDDPAVAPVLLNDVDALSAALRANPSLLNHRTTMVSAFTPLVGASLLHVAAEYGSADAARVLIDMGADVHARAANRRARAQRGAPVRQCAESVSSAKASLRQHHGRRARRHGS